MKFFVKVKDLKTMIENIIKEASWSDNDLIFLDIEKPTGGPMEFLEKKYLKEK